jgi:hypothetical protein
VAQQVRGWTDGDAYVLVPADVAVLTRFYTTDPFCIAQLSKRHRLENSRIPTNGSVSFSDWFQNLALSLVPAQPHGASVTFFTNLDVVVVSLSPEGLDSFEGVMRWDDLTESAMFRRIGVPAVMSRLREIEEREVASQPELQEVSSLRRTIEGRLYDE